MDPFQLSRLPGEVLDLICSEAHLLLALWRCGNANLNSKLTQGVTCASFASHWSLQFGLPPLISNLRSLRHLSLFSRGKIMKNRLDWPTFMKSLPNTLETLEIVCENSVACLVAWTPTGSSLSSYPMGKSHFIDLHSLFPRLHTLKVHTSPDHEDSSPIMSSDLAGLPPTLTRLKAEILISDPTQYSLFALLPRSLIHLDATVESPTNEASSLDWQHAPPHLETISEIRVNYAVNSYSWIPSSVVHAKITDACSLVAKQLGLSHLFTPENFYSFPRLDTLEFASSSGWLNASESWYSILPLRITRLDLICILKSFSAVELAMIPRSVTRFSFQSNEMDWNSIEQAYTIASADGSSIWPPNLLDLEFHAPTMPTHFSLLPATLHRLKLRLSRLRDANLQVDALPQNLTDLYITFLYSRRGSSETFSCVGAFPRGLTSLGLENSFMSCSINLSLPRNLIFLQVPGLFDYTMSDTCALTCLHVVQWSLSALHLIPPTLTSLDLVRLNDSAVKTKIAIDLSSLPRSMTSIVISSLDYRTRKSSLVLTSFAHMPRLKVLHLPDSLKLPSTIFRHLPKTLTDLNLQLSTLEDKHCPFIPPFLERSHINWDAVSGNALLGLGDYWPLALSRFPETIQFIVKARLQAISN